MNTNSNHIVLSLDLEKAQPSDKIIQIGACIGNLFTGEVISTFNEYVNPEEPLSEFIVKLTGITEEIIQTKSISLIEAYRKLVDWAAQYPDRWYQPITWGGDDMRELKEQVTQEYDKIIPGKVFNWPFARRIIDVKCLYQFRQISLGVKPQSGLAKSLTKLGLKFEGRKHSADSDAIQTFRLASVLCKEIKNAQS